MGGAGKRRGANMTNDELIAAHHLDQMRNGLRPNSIEKRDNALTVFARSLGERSLLEVDRKTIDLFLDARRGIDGGPIVPATRYSWLSHLSSFYLWAIREEIGTVDPTAQIRRPKVNKGLPRPAPDDELRRALEVANPRERCWLLLASLMGLRCQEIAGIRREDVVDAQGQLMIAKGKGGKERMVPLHPDVLAALRGLPMPRAGWVFTRPRGGPYSPSHLSQEFNKFLRRPNGDRHAKAHQLRHWFGTSFYAQTHDIRMTQAMLGHQNPATTAIYTAFDTKATGPAIAAMTFAVPEPDEAA